MVAVTGALRDAADTTAACKSSKGPHRAAFPARGEKTTENARASGAVLGGGSSETLHPPLPTLPSPSKAAVRAAGVRLERGRGAVLCPRKRRVSEKEEVGEEATAAVEVDKF